CLQWVRRFCFAVGTPFLLAVGMPFLLAVGALFLLAVGMPFLLAVGALFLLVVDTPFLPAAGTPFLLAAGMPFLPVAGVRCTACNGYVVSIVAATLLVGLEYVFFTWRGRRRCDSCTPTEPLYGRGRRHCTVGSVIVPLRR
ncbi:hypothetical protein, partial [Paenibacillus cisolokensis]|uniref:hypothetical protein n=1 Tax=Paenibacillus cisolokensis TaxID=1658519 RepID=UPI001BCEB94F